MALKLEDLPADMQKQVKKGAKIRIRKPKEDTLRHALAITAMLLDDRKLTILDARKVLSKAGSLLK